MSDITLLVRDAVITKLNEGEVNLEFTKADGTTRKMLATRNNNLIPESQLPKEVVLAEGEETKPENTDIVKCFDLEVMGWRSFRVDSLISFNEKE